MIAGFRFGRFLAKVAAGTCLMTLVWAPVVRAEQYFNMERPDATLHIVYELTDESISNPFFLRAQRIRLVRPELTVSTRGWVYHPAFLRYTLRLKPEWQDQAITGTNPRTDRSRFMGYLLDTDFFKDKRVGLTLFSERHRTEFSSSLAPRRVTRLENSRVTMIVRTALFPTNLSLEYRDTETDDFYSARENTRTVRLESRYPGRENSASLRLADVREDRTVGGAVVHVDSRQGSLNGTLALGEPYRLHASIVTNRSHSELLRLRYLLATTRLDARHTEHLNSHVQLQLNQHRAGAVTSDTTIASVSVNHQLYENLTTTVDFRRSDSDQNIGRIRFSEAGLGFRYTRPIPWGTVGATHSQRVQLEDNDISSPLTPVINETHTLTGTTPSFLARPNVDTASVVVTDLTGVIVYTLGTDYTLVVVGNTVGVARETLGGIADGQQVLVSYSFTSQLPFSVMRRAIHSGATLDLWEALRLFTSVDQAINDLRSGTWPTDTGNDRIVRLGAELKWKWSTTRVEYEDRGTVVSPMTRKLIGERVQFALADQLSVGFGGERVETGYTGTGQWLSERRLSGDLRRRLLENGTVEMTATRRNTRGTLQQIQTRQLLLRWSWRFGEWTGSFVMDSLNEKDGLAMQARDRDRVTIQATRVF